MSLFEGLQFGRTIFFYQIVKLLANLSRIETKVDCCLFKTSPKNLLLVHANAVL